MDKRKFWAVLEELRHREEGIGLPGVIGEFCRHDRRPAMTGKNIGTTGETGGEYRTQAVEDPELGGKWPGQTRTG